MSGKDSVVPETSSMAYISFFMLSIRAFIAVLSSYCNTFGKSDKVMHVKK